MPKREDIKTVMIIGSGPIVIGQAAEFDYAGTQACLALKEEGYEVILLNSNPATIMTDPVMADATYIEPLNVERIAQIIEKERPDALLLDCVLYYHIDTFVIARNSKIFCKEVRNSIFLLVHIFRPTLVWVVVFINKTSNILGCGIASKKYRRIG